MVKLPTSANACVLMQVAIALLSELLTALVAPKWLGLRVRPCMAHRCGQGGEGAFAYEARHTKVETTCFIVQHIAAL